MEKNKSQQFRQYKQELFQQLSQDRSKLFNWFLEHNSTFHFIDPRDERLLKNQYLNYVNLMSNTLIGSFLGVLVVDKLVFPRVFPNFRIKNFRGLAAGFKYIGIPLLAYGFVKTFYTEDIEFEFFRTEQKYNFGFRDFDAAMRIWERAQRAGKLQQLMELKDKFDWTGIPELPDSRDIDKFPANKF